MLQKYGFVVDAARMREVLNQVSGELPMAAMDGLAKMPKNTFGTEELGQRAKAMSNMVIAVAEEDPSRVSVESIKSMDSDAVKARAIAGYVLGVSRHFNDVELEMAVKRQLMQNQYNFGDLNSVLANSKLPVGIAGQARELLSSY